MDSARHRLLGRWFTPTLGLSLSLTLFTLLMLPGIFPASRTTAEILTFSMDEAYFMIPPLKSIAAGHYPGFFSYGNFPAFFAGALFSPFFIAAHILKIEPGIIHLAVISRLSQLVAALIGLSFLYRLSKRFCSTTSSLLVVILVMTTQTFCIWTLTIHPDIHQMCTFIMGLYFLILHHDHARRRDLVFSAIAIALSISSKFWGIFLLPAVLISLCVRRQAGGYPGVLRQAGLYGLIVATLFFAINLNFLTHSKDVLALAGYYTANFHVLRFAPLEADFLKMKLSLLSSPGLYGSLFLIGYLGVLAKAAVRWASPSHAPRFVPLDLIHVSFLSAMAYVFCFFNDPTNLPGGERYLLPFMAVIPVPLAVLVESALTSKRMRWVGGLALGLLVISQGLRLSGVQASSVQLGQGDILGRKSATSVVRTLSTFYFKERQGIFRLHDWVAANATTGDTIYAEAFMNLDETLRVRRITVDLDVRPERIPELNPDYVFTKRESLAKAIARENHYRFLGILGDPGPGEVFILKRPDRR